jgi:hypothetical protein
MNKLLIRAQIETTVIDYPLLDGNQVSRPEVVLLFDSNSMYVLEYAVVHAHNINKAVVSALQKGYEASRKRSNTSLNYSIDWVLMNGYHLVSDRIKQVAMRLGINLAYTRTRYNGRIEALVRNVSVTVRRHQPGNGCDNSYQKNVETFKQELGRAIAAHNETPMRNQLRSPREFFYHQHTAST